MSEKSVAFEYCDKMVEDFEKVIEHPVREKSSVYYTGVDLGTACVVIAVLDENKRPVAGAYRYADVVRDGMVVDYIGAVQIVRELKEQIEEQLDTELSGTSKKLKTYIYPTFLTLANQKGTYAIPNNHPVGEYEYLLVNKELVEQYDYDIADLNTLIKCEGFIEDIGFQNLDGVVRRVRHDVLVYRRQLVAARFSDHKHHGL